MTSQIVSLDNLVGLVSFFSRHFRVSGCQHSKSQKSWEVSWSFYIVCRFTRYGQLKFGDFGQKRLKTDCSATTFVTAHDFLSLHINHFCQPHRFSQLFSTQSSPVLSQISITYVTTDGVTTFVNRSGPPTFAHLTLLTLVAFSLSRRGRPCPPSPLLPV